MAAVDYEAYVEAAWPRLYRTAYALAGDRASAEDLVQATLVKAYVAWRKVQRADETDAYVRRIMVNHAVSGWRRRSRRREVLAADPVPASTGTGEPAIDTVLAESDAVWRAVRALPSRQRAVVVLRYYEDLSEQQIADALGVSTGTVKSQASAAMKRLRSRLGEPSAAAPTVTVPSTTKGARS